MTSILLAVLVGCAPQPASITIEGEPSLTVYNTDAVALPNAKVLDASGKAIEPAPAITWTVTPADAAKVDATAKKIMPAGEGKVELAATVGEIKGKWAFDVVIPDGVKVTGIEEGGTVVMGTPVQLTAEVFDATAQIPPMPIEWKSSAPEIATVDNGLVTPVAVGAVTITASGAGHEASLGLNVAETAPEMASVAAPM